MIDVLLACFAIANIYYSIFGKLLENFLPWPQLQDNIKHYKLYSKLMEGFYPLFIDYKDKKNIKSKDVKRDNNNTSYWLSDNNNKSEVKNNISGENKDDVDEKNKNNVSKKNENNADREDKNNANGESEDNASKDGEILNVKLRVKNANERLRIGNADEKLNLDKIVAGKFTIVRITKLLIDIPVPSIVTLDYLIIFLFFSLFFFASSSYLFSCAISSFFTLVYSLHSFPTLFIFGLPSFFYLGVKGRSLVPDLVTCNSRDAQRE